MRDEWVAKKKATGEIALAEPPPPASVPTASIEELFKDIPKTVDLHAIADTRERILTLRMQELREALQDSAMESRNYALKRAYADIPEDISDALARSNPRSQELLRRIDQIRKLFPGAK